MFNDNSFLLFIISSFGLFEVSLVQLFFKIWVYNSSKFPKIFFVSNLLSSIYGIGFLIFGVFIEFISSFNWALFPFKVELNSSISIILLLSLFSFLFKFVLFLNSFILSSKVFSSIFNVLLYFFFKFWYFSLW